MKKTDNRRKVTESVAKKMTSLLGKGKTLTEVANKFNVSTYAVKYNTDNAFKKSELVRKRSI